MCCGDVVSGMTICGAGNFWVSLALDLLLSPPSEMERIYRRVGNVVLCGAVLYVSNLGYPFVFTLIVLHVLGCEFSSCLGVV